MSGALKDRVVTRISSSGRCVMQIVTAKGHSATCEFPTRAEAFLKIDWLRARINSDAPDQRGPAAARRASE